MIDVEMMEDAKHPLSLFIDNELDAEVTQSRHPLEAGNAGKTVWLAFFCVGGEIPIQEADEFAGGHAHVQPGQRGFTFTQAECFRPVQPPAKGESRSSQSSKIQTGIFTRAPGCFYQNR